MADESAEAGEDAKGLSAEIEAGDHRDIAL
jgi:hypothetical protein